ncbi:MAG: SDR family oxidoreductase [Alphaproteobacteria bacterium]|nr:SDR family oxidoreductase [Alphaproteobacteria bacterium]
MRLEGKAALVTGGGTGLGLAVAKLFHAEGAKVAICGRRAEVLAKAAATIGPDVIAECCDVTDEAAVDAMVAAVARQFGRLDLLVHAAGIHPQRADIDKTTLDGFRQTMEGNTTATFLVARAAVRHMTQGSAIVVIGSIVAQLGSSNRFPYSTSKAALVGMVRQMAVSLGPRGIRVNLVQPGMVRTEMTEGLLDSMKPEQLERMRKAYPLGRFGEPDDVAQACLYLCSDGAGWVTGVTLNVDGGVSLP